MDKYFAIALVMFALVVGCTEKKTPLEAVPSDTTFVFHQFPCQEIKTGKNDSVVVVVENNDVLIWHYNIFSNCCDTITCEYKMSGETLKVYEKHGQAVCYCECYFTTSCKIFDLDSGKYYLNIYRDNDSNILWQGIIYVPHLNPTGPVFNYQSYACSKSSPKGDSVSVTVEGRSILVWHYDLYSNCGAQIKVYFKTILDSLIITETDTVPAFMDCDCYFPVSSRIDSLYPGKYNLVIYQHSYYWPQEWTTIYKDTIRID